MPNIKRRGVLAALLGGIGVTWAQSTYVSSAVAENISFDVVFQKGPRPGSGFTECRGVDEGKGLNTSRILCTPISPIPEPEYVIKVKYGDREVKLTAKEVMDILEGVA